MKNKVQKDEPRDWILIERIIREQKRKQNITKSNKSFGLLFEQKFKIISLKVKTAWHCEFKYRIIFKLLNMVICSSDPRELSAKQYNRWFKSNYYLNKGPGGGTEDTTSLSLVH